MKAPIDHDSATLLLLSLLAGTLLISCKQEIEKSATPTPPCCRELEASTAFTDGSLYQLETEWTSDVGRKIQLGVLRGTPQIVILFFTHCEFTCPIILSDLRRIEMALPETVRDRVEFLLVSMDSERDTPSVLHEFRETHKLPVANWTLLRGEPDDVRELAALLGVNYKRDERGQFAHSNVITLLNAEGEIAYQEVGLNRNPTPLVGAVERLFQTE